MRIIITNNVIIFPSIAMCVSKYYFIINIYTHNMYLYYRYVCICHFAIPFALTRIVL